MGSSIRIEKVNLEAGKNYTFIIEGVPFPFTAEDGGIVAATIINGSVLDGKVILRAGDREYEGEFDSGNTANLTYSDPQGNTGSCIARLQ